MTTTLDDVTPRKKKTEPSAAAAPAELVRLAKEQGLSLTGPDGLLKQFTKKVLQTALPAVTQPGGGSTATPPRLGLRSGKTA